MNIKGFGIFLALIVVSIVILNYKGYFYVTSYIVANEPKIEEYMNSSLTNTAFYALDKNKIRQQIQSEFSDVKDIGLKRNLNLSVTVFLEKRLAFAKSKIPGVFLSEEGIVFLDNLNAIEKSDMPTFSAFQYDFNSPLLSVEQIGLLRQLQNYPDFEIDLTKENEITLLLSDGPVITIDATNKDYLEIGPALNQMLTDIKGGTKKGSKLYVIGNKIIIKE